MANLEYQPEVSTGRPENRTQSEEYSELSGQQIQFFTAVTHGSSKMLFAAVYNALKAESCIAESKQVFFSNVSLCKSVPSQPETESFRPAARRPASVLS